MVPETTHISVITRSGHQFIDFYTPQIAYTSGCIIKNVGSTDDSKVMTITILSPTLRSHVLFIRYNGVASRYKFCDIFIRITTSCFRIL